jgi:hypothetical protein
MLRDDLELRVVLGDVNPAEMGVQLVHGCHQASLIGLPWRMLIGVEGRATQGNSDSGANQSQPFSTIHGLTFLCESGR